jgi:hypothetical protein
MGSIIESNGAGRDRSADLIGWRGRPVREVVPAGLASSDAVQRAAALACLNGSIRRAASAWDGKATEPFEGLVPRERTCVIGHFETAERWRAAGYPVSIVELDPQPGDVHWQDAGDVMLRASIVFITGFTLLNGTFREVVARTPHARLRILMGPTVPGSARLLEHGVHVVGGTDVADPPRLLRYFQDGGTSVRRAPAGTIRRFNIAEPSVIQALRPLARSATSRQGLNPEAEVPPCIDVGVTVGAGCDARTRVDVDGEVG